MNVRLLGAAFLIVGCYTMGKTGANRMKHNSKMLRELIAGLNAIEQELVCRTLPLPALLEHAARNTAGIVRDLFIVCAGDLDRGTMSFSTIWCNVIETFYPLQDGPEKEALSQLGNVLGRYDTESQRKALSRTIAKLSAYSAETDKQCKHKSRVYGAVGLTAGLFIAILLI